MNDKTKGNTVQAALDAQNFYKYGYAPGQQDRVDAYAKASRPASNIASSSYASTGIASWYNVSNPSYLKGALLGAGLVLLVTNPSAQKAIISGAVRLWTGIQGAVEEVKEQVQDVKAELSQEDLA